MRAIACLFLAHLVLSGQVCRFSVAGVNRNRRVTGDIAAECPDPLHTAPFGNWGATSNFGPKRNGHQFQGWCHDTRICDNAGNCRKVCRDGWYEWNTCTTDSLFRAPNCTLYNSAECTEQVSTMDVNVLGTQNFDVPVACPSTSNGSSFDRGGCAEVPDYTRTDNFISLYELDPITGDELIQSLYFPAIQVPLKCTPWGCPPTGSEWANPIGWDSPSTPAKVFAEMAIVVNSGTFVDSAGACRIPALNLRAVSSASFLPGTLADGSIATAFAGNLVMGEFTATTLSLPTTLGGLQVRVTDAAGSTRNAGLLYAGPAQLNFVLPGGMSEGRATINVVAGNAVRATGVVDIARVQPALFSADATGLGQAAAVGIQIGPNNEQVPVDLYQCTESGCEAKPLQAREQNVLVLFGTGIRNRRTPGDVRVTVGGVPVDVLYAGPQPTYIGLDQVNVLLPKDFPVTGVATVRLTVEGRIANAVTVLLQ